MVGLTDLELRTCTAMTWCVDTLLNHIFAWYEYDKRGTSLVYSSLTIMWIFLKKISQNGNLLKEKLIINDFHWKHGIDFYGKKCVSIVFFTHIWVCEFCCYVSFCNSTQLNNHSTPLSKPSFSSSVPSTRVFKRYF